MRIPCSLLAATLASALSAQQQLLLPPTHHLSEGASQTSGSSSIWRSAGGRVQILYDAPAFLASGVSGPITITKLRFRGEDTEANHGGQTFSNVTVQLAATSLSAAGATWSTTFANNLLPATTTAGNPGTFATVVVAPSLGTAPNNYCIDLDLTSVGAAFTFDPTSGQPNLLIDIFQPTAPVATIGTNLNLILMQDTTGTAAQLSGSCRVGSTTATTGTTVNPPVVNVEFTGAGGYTALTPARVAGYGAACGGSPSAFYQLWRHNEAFDLANSTLTLTPDNVAAPNLYTVTGTGPAFDATKVGATAISTVDDAIVPSALGFTFNYPGGSTTQIRPSTNGHLWLDAGTQTGDFSPTLAKWLGSAATETARLAPCWNDFHCGRNLTTHPNSGLHFFVDTSGGPGQAVAYTTWLDVGRANSASAVTTAQPHGVYNLQCVMYEATGVVEFRYGTMSPITGGNSGGQITAITGFTRGRIGGLTASVDPQSRDLSVEVPFSTAIEGTQGHVGLVPVQAATVPTNAPGRLFQGQSITWNAVNVPAGALFGAQLLDIAASQPGFALPTITAPGCMLSTSTGALLWETFLFPTATTTGTVPFAIPGGYNPGILGIDLFAQFVLLDGVFTGGDLISAASNSLKHTVGLQ